MITTTTVTTTTIAITILTTIYIILTTITIIIISQDHLSMYCESKQLRQLWGEGLAKEQHEEEIRMLYKDLQTKRFIDPYKNGEIGNIVHEKHEDYKTTGKY